MSNYDGTNTQPETWEMRMDREREAARLKEIEENKDKCPLPHTSKYGTDYIECRKEACKWYVKDKDECAIVLLVDIYVPFD